MQDLSPLIALDASSGPLYQQIYRGYRAAILDGRLRPGQRLSSTRALALELGISRLPVLNAFEQLLHEGYLEGRAGSGTYVASGIRDKAGTRPGPPAATPFDAATATSPGTIDAAIQPNAFRTSLPALDRFPRRTWARLVSRHARDMPLASMAYGDPAGHLPLRRAIADYLCAARGLVCDADQILIVSGSQMALQLCARVLLAPGDAFCVEEPGYPGAREALGATGATLRPVPVDAAGLVVRSMAVGRRAARLAYVTPSHQYPLGGSMDASRRLALLEWARRHRSWIVEDDYDSDYRYASRPLGALQGMDPSGRVIYIGTFSKVLFPALRTGYLVVPRTLVDRFVAARRAFDLFPPTLYALALTDFLCEGHFARHLRRMRALYLARRNALVGAIQARLDGELSLVNTDAGMHVAAWLRDGVDDREVVRCAATRGISVTALSTCYAGKVARSGLVLGFAGTPEETMVPNVERLAQAIADARRP